MTDDLTTAAQAHSVTPMNTYLTSKDIAKLVNVKPATVRQWRARFGDFPQPAAVYGDTPVYAPADVRRWLVKHGRAAA